MNCTSCGHEMNENAKFCPQCGNPVEKQEEPIIEVQEEPEKIEVIEEEQEQMDSSEDKEVNKDWYYVSNQNEQMGPYTEAEMIGFIQNHVLYGNTYVWKSGLADWIRLKDSDLAQYLVQEQNHMEQPTVNSMGNHLSIAPRSIALDVLLTIVTCGLYYFYWLYVLARNINTIEQSKGIYTSTSPGMVVILSIVTCNIYGLFFYWKAGKTVAGLTTRQGYRIDNDAFVLVLLSFLGLSVVSNAILENNLNDIDL